MKHRSIALLLLLLMAAPAFPECRVDRFTQIRGYPVELEVESGLAWIADGAGLTAVDVTNPFAPRLRHSTFEESPTLALEVLNEGEIALLTTDRLLIYDVTGEVPVVVESAEATGKSVHALGSRLIVVGHRLTAFERVDGALVEDEVVALEEDAVSSASNGNVFLVAVKGIGTVIFDEGLDRRGRISLTATAIVIDQQIAYLGRGDGLFPVDLSDLDQPDVLAALGSGVSVSRLVLRGEELIATDGESMVHVIDVSRADEPALIRSVEAEVTAMATDGEYLYGYGFDRDRFGTRFENGPYLSVRDLGAPELEIVGSAGSSTGPLRGVATDGSVAWLADPPFLRAVDLQTGDEVWSLELDEPFDRVRYENDLLVLWGATWVHLVEPDAIAGRLLGTWPTRGTPGGGVAFSGEWLIEVNRSSGFHVLDISDPSNIVQRGGLINDGRGQWMEVAGIPGAVYGIVNTGIKVVSLGEDPAAVAIVDFLNFGKPIDVEIATVGGRDYLLVLDGSNVRVHDLTDPLGPVEIGVVNVGPGRMLSVSDETVAALGEGGIVSLVDLSEPAVPVIIDAFEGMREGLSVAFADEVLVGADRWALWSMPLTLAEESEAPLIEISDENASTVSLEWSAREVHQTQIQIATDPEFQNVETDRTIWDVKLTVEKASQVLWMRARFRTGCAASEWSNAMTIDAERTRGRSVRRP